MHVYYRNASLVLIFDSCADFSPDYTDTWESLERRIDDVMTLGKATSQAGGLVSSLASNVNDLLSTFGPGGRR